MDPAEVAYLESLPNELLEKVLINVKPENMIHVCLTSTRFHVWACKNPRYWKEWLKEYVDLPDKEFDTFVEDLMERGEAGPYYMEMKSGRLQRVRQKVEEAKINRSTQLNLSEMGIKYLPPGIFSGLTSLQYLSLSNNQLTDIQGVFTGLNSLQELYLSNNQLGKGNLQDVFSGLTSLQKVYLYNNQLTDIQGVFTGLTSLQDLFLDNNQLNMNRKRLDPDKKEEIKLSLRVLHRGMFTLKPRIGYLNGMGHETFFELGPETIEISENILPGRINTGYDKLDSLLLGGIPHNYAVILTSISCDERDMLIRRFLEGGARSGQLTLYITVEARGVKRLAEKFQSNFYLFLCNPQADTIIEALPNVFKLKGVENLTEINIALTSILRTLPTSQDGQGRACIEIVSDVLLQHGAVHTRRWLTSLIPDLKSKGFTTLAVMNPYMHLPQEVQAIPDLFEGEISIFERDSVKYLKIRKMYGQKYLDSELPLRKTAPNTTRPSRARLL